MKSHFYLLLFFLASVSIHVSGQKTTTASTKKFTPPAVNTFLADMSAPNASCMAETGRQAIQQPLLVLDKDKNGYRIARYELAYTRVGVTEDENTGKTFPTKDMVGRRFTEVPLPELWRKNITETLQKGETLFFYDIYCYDKQGRLFAAPSLKIDIK